MITKQEVDNIDFGGIVQAFHVVVCAGIVYYVINQIKREDD